MSKGDDGVQWPAGTYTLTATGKDSSGNNVAISTKSRNRQFSRSHRFPAAAAGCGGQITPPTRSSGWYARPELALRPLASLIGAFGAGNPCLLREKRRGNPAATF